MGGPEDIAVGGNGGMSRGRSVAAGLQRRYLATAAREGRGHMLIPRLHGWVAAIKIGRVYTVVRECIGCATIGGEGVQVCGGVGIDGYYLGWSGAERGGEVEMVIEVV